jgi:hypothetical protein
VRKLKQNDFENLPMRRKAQIFDNSERERKANTAAKTALETLYKSGKTQKN